MSVPLTVIFPVKDEEENLPDALASVAWADEVIVVDSQSRDRTAEIAGAAGAEVVQFRARSAAGRRRRRGRSPTWPRGTSGCCSSTATSASPTRCARRSRRRSRAATSEGYYVDRELVFMGRKLRCFNPNWNMRLFRRGHGRMEDLELHDVPGPATTRSTSTSRSTA